MASLEPADRISCVSVAQRLRHHPWTLAPHAVPAHQFLWINKGAGRLQIEGTTRGFAPNSAFFIPAGRVVGFDLNGANSGWFITIPENASLALPFRDEIFLQLIGARGQQAQLAAICDDIQREAAPDDPTSRAALICHVGLLSVWLARQKLPEKPRQSPSQRLVANFLGLLELRYPGDEGVAEYATLLEVTPTHLARVCKSVAGRTANTLIQDRKILAAKIELADTDKKIADIAAHSGFGSAAYFTRLFSQRSGTSPRQFRIDAKQNRESRRASERQAPPLHA